MATSTGMSTRMLPLASVRTWIWLRSRLDSPLLPPPLGGRASEAVSTARASGSAARLDERYWQIRLTRMPSFAFHATASSPISGVQSLPPLASQRSLPLTRRVSGTELWCSATTCQELLNTGEPDEPETVSVWYQRYGPSSEYLRSLFSRTQTCFRSPLGCWMMVRYSPMNALPGSGLSRSQPNGSSAWPRAERGSA